MVAPLMVKRSAWPGVAAARVARPDRTQARRFGRLTAWQWAAVALGLGLGVLVLATMLVAVVRWLLSLEAVSDFVLTYPGETHLPDFAPVGIPPWLAWQHALNAFFLILIVRTGLTVRRQTRPTAYWAPRRDAGRKISVMSWLHQALDVLWMLNGAAFIIMLFATGQWVRVVPTTWEVIPNAVSAALQYVSLDWPTENGWVNYNSLQQLAYFTTIFVAAPLAIATGVRMSAFWPRNSRALDRIYPVEWARAIHFPVMLYFATFLVIHVCLVLATGALRNLNHMYAAMGSVEGAPRTENWTGILLFALSIVMTGLAVFFARPAFVAPLARLTGTVTRG